MVDVCRRVFILIAAMILIAAVMFTSLACLADGGSVTVSVRVVRVIEVNPAGAHANAGLVRQVADGLVTYVSP